jgi:hypothetical protein
MKKVIYILLAGLLISSCSDITDINTDTNSAYTTEAYTLVSYAQKELSDYMNTPSVNENNFRLTMQYWQETTYVDESNYDFVTRNISNNTWLDNYVYVLNNLNQAKTLINEYSPTASESATWAVTKQNQLAIIDMQMVYVFQTLVDMYGDIPYSEALDSSNSLPAYDDDSEIYPLLITRLEADIADLDTDGSSFDIGDDFYGGDVSSWKKFGNSLLLKLGITIADADATLAQATVNTAISGGLFTSSDDSCLYQYLTDSPNFNPLYENLVDSGRNDFVGGATLVDAMNTSSDPRISVYYQPLSDGTYKGGTIGSLSSYSTNSSIGTFAEEATTPGNILTYTEVTFYLAEAAARWTPATAATAYELAVETSMLEWGVSSSDITTYLAANPYDSTSWKESIGEQAWVAMFNQAIVGWNFYRRLDYPVLTAPSTAVEEAYGLVPVRLTYPVKESTTNPTNWAAAGIAIGGDELTTKVFWDVN